jgi:hypothetical protein
MVKAEYGDVMYVADNLRPFDITEIYEFGRTTPMEQLKFSFFHAEEAWIVKYKGLPCAFFGYIVYSRLTGIACPFFFATPVAEAHPRLFAKYSKIAMKSMGKYSLHNFTISSNTWVLRWLEWLGFTIGEEVSMAGKKVKRFSREADKR